MTSRNLCMKLCAAALVSEAALGMGLLLAEPGNAADAEPASACPAAGKPDSRFMGASYCRRCHTNGEAFQFPSKLATLDEFPIWDKRDKHRHAFEALTGDRARQMESLLGMKPGEAATSRECMACHTIGRDCRHSGPIVGRRRQTSCGDRARRQLRSLPRPGVAVGRPCIRNQGIGATASLRC